MSRELRRGGIRVSCRVTSREHHHAENRAGADQDDARATPDGYRVTAHVDSRIFRRPHVAAGAFVICSSL